jgi:L-aspartate oxidase
VGIVRTQAELEEALAAVRKLKDQIKDLVNDTLEKMALQNEVLLAEQIIQAAILRKESRGGHFRSDFPNRDDEHWKCHIVITKEGTEMR